jgi:hypothetical protein
VAPGLGAALPAANDRHEARAVGTLLFLCRLMALHQNVNVVPPNIVRVVILQHLYNIYISCCCIRYRRACASDPMRRAARRKRTGSHRQIRQHRGPQTSPLSTYVCASGSISLAVQYLRSASRTLILTLGPAP